MDPKYQKKVKLNDGHFILVLGFGTFAPPEVRVVTWGEIKIVGGCMGGRELHLSNTELLCDSGRISWFH